MKIIMKWIPGVSLILLLAACAGTPSSTKPEGPTSHPAIPTEPKATLEPSSPATAQSVAPEPTPAQKALNDGVSAYERGDFSAAIRILSPLVKDKDGALTQAQMKDAYKTLAFAECLNRQTTNCRSTFEKAMRADPSFELTPAERGHPIWGPQYDRARKAVQSPQK